jgi:flotillin
MAQLPPVLESLTGVKFDQLLKQIPSLRNAINGDVPPRTDPTVVAPLPEKLIRNS